MLSQKALDEFCSKWLPNSTDSGLDHLLSLLDRHSPTLIRGRWCSGITYPFDPATKRAGCLATQLSWFDSRVGQPPATSGEYWLKSIVGIKPEESEVLREWDGGAHVVAELAYLVREEQQRRLAQTQAVGSGIPAT